MLDKQERTSHDYRAHMNSGRAKMTSSRDEQARKTAILLKLLLLQAK
jgi:hypothetical protein